MYFHLSVIKLLRAGPKVQLGGSAVDKKSVHRGGLKSTEQLLILDKLRRRIPPLNSAAELHRELFSNFVKHKSRLQN